MIGCILGCGRIARSLGLCNYCKGAQDRAIKRKETTAKKLIKDGKRLASRRQEWLDEARRWRV